MNEVATAPGSCELNKTLNRNWAVQIKPKGADASEYMFVRGLDSANVNIETQAVDSSDIDSQGWTAQTKTSRTLTVALAGKFSTVTIDGEQKVLEPSQALLRDTGEALGEAGELDVRVWRTDGTDEAWECSATNLYSAGEGDANALRTFTANLQASCAPTKIKPVLKGGEREESIPADGSAAGEPVSP